MGVTEKQINVVKRCNKCNEDKPLSEFTIRKESNTHRNECKKCMVIKAQLYVARNKDKVRKYKKEYGKKNREVLSAKGRVYKSKPEVRERLNALSRKYTKNNPEKFKERRKMNRRKRNEFMKKYNSKMSKTNPSFNIISRLRSRVYAVLNGEVKKTTTTEFLGCTIEQFKIYFESLFTEGMSWDVYLTGGIHIDHIIPCKHFDLTDPQQQKKCFHYTNLQPLWELDNLKKGVSMPEQLKVA